MEALMKIDSPLHAEHQLDQLAGQFEHWRQTRTHPGERFPQALWDQAVALAATLPPSRAAKQLRLRLIDLKKQMAAPHAAPSLPLGFVEVPPLPPAPQEQERGSLEIELHRPDGARLRLHAPAASLSLAALVQSFVEARSCSN
jgi:hypothetical protein